MWLYPEVLVVVCVVPQTEITEGERLRPRIWRVWEGSLVPHVVDVKDAASLGKHIVAAGGGELRIRPLEGSTAWVPAAAVC